MVTQNNPAFLLADVQPDLVNSLNDITGSGSCRPEYANILCFGKNIRQNLIL